MTRMMLIPEGWPVEDYASGVIPNGGRVTAEMLMSIGIDFQKAQRRGKPIYDALKEALQNAGLQVEGDGQEGEG